MKRITTAICTTLACVLMVAPVDAIEVTRVYGGSGDAIQMHAQQLVELRQRNSEIEGWLTIPGTNINYPLAANRTHTCSTHNTVDNCWYVNRDIYGNVVGRFASNGAVFVDTRNAGLMRTQLSKNTVIYGHNWTNIQSRGGAVSIARSTDLMFAQLPGLSNINVATGIPFFSIENGTESLTFLIFAVAYTDTYDSQTNPNGFYYIATDPNETEFTQLITNLQTKSLHKYSVPVDSTDKIVTLSTCTYKDRQDGNGRFIVVGRLLRANETPYDYVVPVPNTH